jgi:hypothetical protein
MRYIHALAKTLIMAALLATVLLPAVRGAGTGGDRAVPAAAVSGGSLGYWLVAGNGAIYQRGTTNYGDLSAYRLARPVVGGSATNDGAGYWMVASDGGIFAFGDAGFHGSTGGIALVRPVVGMAADPATSGYWMVASDGGVFAFGAGFYGSTGGVRLVQPIVGMASTPSGHGYWMVAADGGVFAFGDARFYGSTGGVRLAQPIVGMAATPSGHGYWLVASDGGIFAFGDAGFHGSTGGVRLNAPVVGMASSPDGGGYWLTARDGGVFPFGDAPFLGASGTNGFPPIVAMMATEHGFPFPPNSTGYDVSQFQCRYYSPGASLPPGGSAVAVVQVSGGAINRAQPLQCYPLEAAWAGKNISDYIFMNPLPSPVPSEARSGPAGNCAAGQTTCESFNFGFYWATYWVNYARAAGTNPGLWWLDVETSGGWNTSAAAQPANAQVIAGAVAALRNKGVVAGIYSTNLQWGEITGYGVSFPHIPLWVPGAEGLNSGPYNAVSFCTSPAPYYSPFAGGTTVLVQYGYNNPNRQFDLDYACP